MNKVLLLLLVFSLCLSACESGESSSSSNSKNPVEKLNYVNLPQDNLILSEIYVPVYSEIYYSTANKKVRLTATISIRNTSLSDTIYVNKVDFFDTHGEKLRQYLEGPVAMYPLQTIEFVVEDRNSGGGSGANFIVEIAEPKPDLKPLIQCVMIGVSGAQGISFITEGVEVEKY